MKNYRPLGSPPCWGLDYTGVSMICTACQHQQTCVDEIDREQLELAGHAGLASVAGVRFPILLTNNSYYEEQEKDRDRYVFPEIPRITMPPVSKSTEEHPAKKLFRDIVIKALEIIFHELAMFFRTFQW